jgi:hypothetical protein
VEPDYRWARWFASSTDRKRLISAHPSSKNGIIQPLLFAATIQATYFLIFAQTYVHEISHRSPDFCFAYRLQ